MNTPELTLLLARIQAVDNRQVDQITLEAWEPLVGDLEYQDALAAVNHHFRESTAWLQPHNVRALAETARRHRLIEAARSGHAHTFDVDSGYCIVCACRDDTYDALARSSDPDAWMQPA